MNNYSHNSYDAFRRRAQRADNYLKASDFTQQNAFVPDDYDIRNSKQVMDDPLQPGYEPPYEYEPSKPSLWVRVMRFIMVFSFALYVAGAVVALGALSQYHLLLAIAVAALIILLGFLTVGMAMVFLGLAADIKAIRDHLENHY